MSDLTKQEQWKMIKDQGKEKLVRDNPDVLEFLAEVNDNFTVSNVIIKGTKRD
jgi:hypothetical protein